MFKTYLPGANMAEKLLLEAADVGKELEVACKAAGRYSDSATLVSTLCRFVKSTLVLNAYK